MNRAAALQPAAHAPWTGTAVERRERARAEAFAELYHQHVERIFRHIRARVADADVAEDVTAQTFLRAWQSVDRYRPMPGRPVLAWLFTIANNLVVDHYRRRRREPSAIVGDPVDGKADDPERCALTADLRDGIRDAIAALKAEQQLVVTLRLIDGAGYDEISAITGKSPGALRVIFCRAVAALRDDLRRRGMSPA